MTSKEKNTLLLVGAAAVAVYFLTRPRTGANPYGNAYLPPAYSGGAYQQPNSTAQTITAASGALTSITDAFKNLFGTGSNYAPATVDQTKTAQTPQIAQLQNKNPLI